MDPMSEDMILRMLEQAEFDALCDAQVDQQAITYVSLPDMNNDVSNGQIYYLTALFNN